ncbi:MAG: hypothetical protein JW795_05580, partial [Chitinivibrionales bacterium]|nr:hypothetical protein [Chitinivibrionales bacterium]
MKSSILVVAVIASFIITASAQKVLCQTDYRQYFHGINFIKISENKFYVIFACSGFPPTQEWNHDIYYTTITPSEPSIGTPQKLITNDECQEPASSAISSDGKIMVTNEDGASFVKHVVAQVFTLFDENLTTIAGKGYYQMIYDGGHSGHVTACGNRFVVFWCDDWVQGGGVDNLGSGLNVKAHIFTSLGIKQQEVDVSVENARDWWPVCAGSPDKAFFLWQRFVDKEIYAKLMFSLMDAATGAIVKNKQVIE